MASSLFDFAGATKHFVTLPHGIEKLVFPTRAQEAIDELSGSASSLSLPVDILDSEKEYVFFTDVPGISKTDIQVTVEEENTLVIRGNGKRKRDEVEEEEECKYIRMERRKMPQKVLRKFRLPENANLSAIKAKCEDGVLSVVVEKLPPPPKPKTVKVDIS